MDAMGRNLRDDPLGNHDFFMDDSRRSDGAAAAWVRFRHALLYIIGFGCLLLGLVLTITVVRLETLQSRPTAELSAIVGLIALPMLTLLSIRLNISMIKQAVSKDYAPSYSEGLADSRIAHHAHNRRGRDVRHIRVNESTGAKSGSQQDTQLYKSVTAV